MLAEPENYNLDEWIFDKGVYRNDDGTVESDDEEVFDGDLNFGDAELNDYLDLLCENVENVTLDNDMDDENSTLRVDENESFADVSDNESDTE